MHIRQRLPLVSKNVTWNHVSSKWNKMGRTYITYIEQHINYQAPILEVVEAQ